AQGQQVFNRAGCAACHTPPLYTNNKLTPADGFNVPTDHREKYDIMPISVGTDPDLTLKTRRGTGYYKVPSLRGVWYRSMFGHSGWCATLEDWFDPHRARDDYVPTGWRPYGRHSLPRQKRTFHLGEIEVSAARRLRDVRGQLVAAVRRPDGLLHTVDADRCDRGSAAKRLVDDAAGHRG